MMKVTEMVQKTDKELEQIAADARKEVADLVIDFRTKKVSNVKAIAAARKRLAQALTLLRERQILQQEKEMEKDNG